LKLNYFRKRNHLFKINFAFLELNSKWKKLMFFILKKNKNGYNFVSFYLFWTIKDSFERKKSRNYFVLYYLLAYRITFCENSWFISFEKKPHFCKILWHVFYCIKQRLQHSKMDSLKCLKYVAIYMYFACLIFKIQLFPEKI
jgi:hypothetical protein